MSHAPIDPLLTLPLPLPRETAAPNRPRDQDGTFDRHFQSVRASDAAAPPPRTQSQNDDSEPRPTPTAEPPVAKSEALPEDSSANPPAAAETPHDTADSTPAETSPDRDATNEPIRDQSESGETLEPGTDAPPIQVPPLGIEAKAVELIADLVPSAEVAEVPVLSSRDAKPTAAAIEAQPAAASRQRQRAAAIPKSVPQSELRAAVSQVAEVDVPTELPPDPLPSSPAAAKAAEKPAAGDAAQLVANAAIPEAVAVQAGQPAEAHEHFAAQDAGRLAPTPREPRPWKTHSKAEPVEPRAQVSHNPAPGNRTGKTTNEASSGESQPVQPNESPASNSNDTPTISTEPVLDAEPAGPQPRFTPLVRAALQPAPPAAIAAVAVSHGAPPDTDNSTEGTVKPRPATTESKPSVLTAFARFERSGPLGARAAQGGDGKSAPHVDPARFVQRVARAIHTAQDRGGPLVLRLSPPELGSLRLELSLQQGVLSATIEADNSQARQMLLDNLPALRDRLADQNVRIERFDVDLRRDGEGRDPSNFQPQQHKQHHQHAPQHRAATSREPSAAEPAAATPTPSRSITDTSINIIA